MPISARQLNLCDVSKDLNNFYNQNQNNLLSFYLHLPFYNIITS